jgi:hypothetical protein
MASGVKDQLADVTTDLKEMSIAKLEEALADFNAALPLLRDAGYVLDGVSVKLGLVPRSSPASPAAAPCFPKNASRQCWRSTRAES